MLHIRGFADGPLTPGVSYAVSCLGLFLGLRCAARALACSGAMRGRWLLLAGVSIGSIGIWAMDVVAMLGFAIPGETSRYHVPVAIASLLAAVGTASAGLLIVGLGRAGGGSLALGGVVTGLGWGAAHYLELAAMRMPGKVTYDPLLLTLSVVITVVAATATITAAPRTHGIVNALGASLLLAIGVCAGHYAGMAAVRVYQASGPAGLALGGAGTASLDSFLPPVTVGVAIVAFLVGAAIALSPNEDAIRYDAALLDHIRRRTETPLDAGTLGRPPPRRGHPPWAHRQSRHRSGLR